MTTNQKLELFAYGCFAAASLLAAGHLAYLAWRETHPKPDKTERKGPGGLLE